ncbi:MAG: hypothetical protein AAF337_14045, partial [Pseudomonadota bacterium]
VELLSALVVAALLMSLLSFTVWSIQDRRTALAQHAQHFKAKEQLSHFLQSVLGNAASYQPGGTDASFFQGTSKTLRFFAPAPAALAQHGLLEYSIDASSEDPQSRLIMVSALPWTPELKASSSLLNDFSYLDFEYLEPAKDGDPPQWQAQWAERAELPQAVKVTATLNAETPDTFEQLVMLHRPIDPKCRYDSLTRDCVR